MSWWSTPFTSVTSKTPVQEPHPHHHHHVSQHRQELANMESTSKEAILIEPYIPNFVDLPSKPNYADSLYKPNFPVASERSRGSQAVAQQKQLFSDLVNKLMCHTESALIHAGLLNKYERRYNDYNDGESNRDRFRVYQQMVEVMSQLSGICSSSKTSDSVSSDVVTYLDIVKEVFVDHYFQAPVEIQLVGHCLVCIKNNRFLSVPEHLQKIEKPTTSSRSVCVTMSRIEERTLVQIKEPFQ